MASFSTTKRKLKKLWEQIVRLDIDQKEKLQNKTDQVDKINSFTKNQYYKNPINIGELQSFSIVPEVINGTQSVVKNLDVPLFGEYDTSFTVEMPEQYLPYLEFSPRITTTPDTRVENIFKYNNSEFSGDNIEVKGDGTLVYKGTPVVARRQIFAESSLNDKGISLTHTKKVFRFLKDGAPSGQTIYGLSWTKTVGDTTTSFSVNFLLGGEHKITAMSSSSFTAVGDETIVIDEPDPDPDTIINNDNVSRTFSFDDADSYTISTVFVNGFGQDIITTFLSANITTREFIDEGLWLYWDSDTINLFDSLNTGTPDGDFTVIQISPGRSIIGQNVGDSSYNQVTFTRNKVIEPEEIVNHEVTAFTKKSTKNYIKISKSTDEIDKFKIQLTGEFLIVGRSNDTLEETQDFPVYDDVFDRQSNGFVETQDHSLLSKEFFALKPTDVEVEIQASFLHPYYAKEDRKYKNDEF